MRSLRQTASPPTIVPTSAMTPTSRLAPAIQASRIDSMTPTASASWASIRIARSMLTAGSGKLSAANHCLSAFVCLLDRSHCLARVLLRTGRRVLVQDLVGADEALYQLDDDRAIDVGEEWAHAQWNFVAHLLDTVVRNAVLHD